jgi:hypothetical protein
MNNVPQVVCIGGTCRKGEFCIHSVFRCIPSQRNDLFKKRVQVDPQSRSPEQKNRISSDRTEETVVKKSKGKKQCNAQKRLETWPDMKEINHFTVVGDQMKPAAVAAASAGSRFGREEKDLRMQPGCRHGEVHGSHLCRHHDHRGSHQSCSPGSANLNQFLVACLPAGLIAMRIVVEE